jgi:UDPglucose 6-dehydrogenase
MRVVVIGTGYVGLVSGACLADFGHEVTCVDSDEAKIAKLNTNVMPIYEPGLAELVERNVEEGRLRFSRSHESVPEAEVVLMAVGTPSRRGDGHADLSYLFAAVKDLAGLIRGYTVIVSKSTVPVGTGDQVETIVREIRPKAEFSVASNPEFLREGAAIEDFKRPDRIVVGVEDERARAVMRELYRPLYLNEIPMLVTSRRTAELIKYATNALLATKVTFINEMADICEQTGANVLDLARGLGLDKRIGSKFLHPGPGYGGSCFPKDTLALVRSAREAGAPTRIVEAVVSANDERKRAMGRRIIAGMNGDVHGKTIAVLGLTFKPNTDDMREAPSLTIVPMLLAAGATVRAFDPEGMDEARKHLDGVRFADDPYEAATGADAIVILTEWDQFRALDVDRLRSVVRSNILFDFRNVYALKEDVRDRFVYYGIGVADPR